MPRPHRLFTTLTLLLALALATANAPQRALQPTPAYATPVQLVTTLEGVKLADALALLGASAGVNIITKDVPDKTVTYRFETPAPFHEILTVILTLEDLAVTVTAAALIIQPAPPTTAQPATPPAQADREAHFYNLDGHPADELARIITTIHPNASVQPANNNARLLITATPEQHQDIQELINDYQTHAPPPEAEEAIADPVLNTFLPVTRELDEVAAILSERHPGAQVRIMRNAQALNITAPESELEAIRHYVSEYERFLDEQEAQGAIESERAIPMVERTYRISNASAPALATTIESILGATREEHDATFVADDRTNKLVVRAPEDLLPEVDALIEELDEPAKQVRVTVRIQEIAQREAQSMGLSVTANAGALVASLVNGAAQFVFDPARAITALNINAVLDTLEGQSLSRTLDNAVLMVANNGTATLNSGGNINVAVQVGEGETATQRSDSISFGTQVMVTPRITNDNRVDLQLTTTVSGFEGELQNVTGLRFSDKTLTTNIVVGDQEVVVIGGLIQNSYVNTVQGVPVLSAIPILGHLFKHDITENNKSELIIVVTAEIIN